MRTYEELLPYIRKYAGKLATEINEELLGNSAELEYVLLQITCNLMHMQLKFHRKIGDHHSYESSLKGMLNDIWQNGTGEDLFNE